MRSRMVRRALLGLGIAVATMGVGAAQENTKSLKVTAIVEHPALDAVRRGVKEELAAQGYKAGDSLAWEFQSAQGDVGTAGQIARKFVGDSPDAIVAIATPSAQAVVAAARGRVPVVFSAVTDPVDAKLVDSLAQPDGAVTGVSDMLPLDQHLSLITEVVPEAKRLGVPYNPGEPNAAVLVERLKQMAPDYDLEIVTASAPSSADVLTAARSLVGKVDAIYVTTDNTIASALESVVKVGVDAGVPVFGGDTSMVERGVVAAVGFDYYDVGRQTGKLVARIFEGANAGDIAVQTVDKTQLYVNPTAAADMGVQLSNDMTGRAYKVVE